MSHVPFEPPPGEPVLPPGKPPETPCAPFSRETAPVDHPAILSPQIGAQDRADIRAVIRGALEVADRAFWGEAAGDSTPEHLDHLADHLTPRVAEHYALIPDATDGTIRALTQQVRRLELSATYGELCPRCGVEVEIPPAAERLEAVERVMGTPGLGHRDRLERVRRALRHGGVAETVRAGEFLG